MRTLLLATLLLVTACKKEESKLDQPKAADTWAATKQPKPVGTAPAGTAIASQADYEAKAIEITDKLLAVFVEAGKDCDKLATNIPKLVDDNRALFEAIKAYEQANPDAQKAIDEKMQARDKEFEQKLGPGFEACQDHPGFKAAIEKLPFNN